MADNYILDGDYYTQEDVLEAAEAKGLTIDDYIKEYYPEDAAGKTTDFSTETQPMKSNVIGSESEDGFLKSVEIVEGKGMFAGETELPSGLGGLVKKVKNTKDFIKDIFNTQDSVKEDDEKVTSKAAEKYFSLDAMPKRKLKPYDGESDFREFENTLEEDLEAYFNSKESLEKGINKYEEYKKWDGGNGELPKHVRFRSDVEVEQKNRKRELTEEYIGIYVPENKQIEAYLALPSVIGDEKEVVIGGKTYKNPKELYNTLKKRDAELGTTKAIDFEADYLATANEGFNNDYEKYEADLAKYEKDNEPILKQQALLVEKFKKLGKVDENSSEQEISEYNALVVENNNLQDQLDQGGANTLIETRNYLKTRFDDLISKAATFENTSMAATALGLDYSLGGRVSLQLEKTFLAGGAVLGTGTMKLLGKLGEVKYPTQQDIKIQEALAQNYKNAINYYDEVGKEIETTLPTTIKVEDINSGNVFEAAKQMLGNNAPSILVALGTSGTGALLTKGMSATAALATRRKMANLGMGIFFEMEAGGKLGDIEVGEKYAAANIDALNAMLERDKKEGIVKTPDEILSIKQQISDNENALSFTGMQKAFSTVMYGGIASYAERLGTLSYMNGLTRTSRVYGAGLFKKTIRGAKGNIYNVGVELLEETATTLGHNLTDITVLGEDKSMIEGIDADFLVNTAFTSLAIQGPSMGMNSYNALKGEVTTRQEREESRIRTQEILQVQNELNNTSPLNFNKRRELTKRKLELLQEAEITDVQVVQKISRMTSKEVVDLFEANRLKREALKNLQELGGDIDSNSEFNKKQKQRLIEEYNKHEGKRELLLGKPDARNKKDLEAKLKELGYEKGVDYDLSDEAEMAFQLGKYQLNQDVLKNIVGAKNVKIFKGENSKQQLEEYLKQKVKDGVISQEDADKALIGDKNAMFIGNEFVLMEDVALKGISNGGGAALFAAASPLHELLHRDLIEAGIVVDGKIVKSAEDVVASIEDHLNSLGENNLIDKKNAKIIKKRIEQYKSKEGVDLEELITLVGDLKDQGIISRETMSLNYDLKRFIKLTAGKLLGDKNAFLGFNTIEDIFRYIDSFQNRAKDQTLVIPPDEKEETVEIKQSKSGFDQTEIIEDLGLKETTAGIVARNTTIEKAILQEGIKDEEGNIKASPAQQRKLAENNLPRAFALAKQAAGRAKDLTLDDALKIDDVMEFYSEYSLKLTELARTYKAQMTDGTKVPFGAYMNSLLPLKYSGILEKLKSKIQTTSMSDEAVGKKVRSIEDTTDETTRTTGVKTKLKQKKSRQLTNLADLDVESSPLIKEVTKIKLKKLIESNPKNLTEQIQEVLISDLVEITRQEMGVIGQVKGELNIPDTYNAYLSDTYQKTISSMEISKIRANYKNLFKKEKMGFADYKTKKSDKPSLKKDSNYILDINRNTTTKAEFIKYHTEGKKNKLIANQKNLAIMRAEAEAVRAAENYIIENSQNLNEIYGAELRNFVDSKTVEKQKQEDKSFDSVKYSKSMALGAFELRDAVLTGENVFDNNGNLIGPYKNIFKNKKDSKAAGDFVWANLHLLGPNTDFRFLVKAYEKLYSEDRGTEYERNLIKTAELVEKEYGIDAFEVVLRKPTEKDALPDMIFKIHGQVMNVEAKMALAQYSSVTNSIVDDKMVVEKQYSPEFMKILAELQKESQKGIKKAKKFLKENKIEWDGFKLLSTEGHNMLINNINPDTGSSYFNGMSATLPLPLKFIAEIYNNKKHPVFLMQLMGRGLFSMGGDTFNLGIPALEDGGDGFITLRVGSNSQYKVATEADVKAGRVTSIYTDGTNVSEKLTKGLKPLLKIGSTITKKAGEDALLDLSDKLDRIGGANAEALAFDLDMAIELMQDGYAKDATKRLKQFNKKSKDILSGASKTKRQVKTGMKTYSYRSIPGISDKVLNDMKSTHNIENLAGMMKLMDSKEVANIKTQQEGKSKTSFSKSVNLSRTIKDSKGITVLDFDDTLATTKSLVKFTRPDGTTGTLNAEEYASTYEDLLDKGFTFDFSDFNKVVKGKTAPLFQKAIKLQGKFGPENMFVLTARPPQAAKAIFDFLKANGLNIPMKNITGLANSTAEAKALWIADKVGDGFNDFYFADDALQNVQAVKNMLDQFDVKSKVQQAKVKFSKGMNDRFNDILENVTGIESSKRFSIIKGRKRGESKGKFRVFIPPSHEDFVGLLYNFLGRGKEGNAHRDFFEQALLRPLNRANREYDTARQSVANDYKALNKQFEDVRKKLTKKTPDGDFTFQDAIRVYLWNKHGHKIPGLSETDQANLSELVMSDPQLQAYAETLNVISKQETYVTPTEGWNSGDIRMDLDDATGKIGRKQYFSEFIENTDIIFSEENLNKIEAGYGKGVRESLEDMLYRIKTGRNRPTGQNEQVNKLMNYLNGSVGTVMFFNMRSALLQQMSIVNYINFADNNIFAAAKAFANQKQYWKDFAFIFNSDMLKQRRGGIQTDVNGAELAASLRNSKDITRKLISKLLELGFLPTQIGDNIAIATGGASYYRNRINKYVKQGLSQKEAEAKAFTDFQAITQSTQQSARPDMVSKQQASVIGKVILNFQNVTSQFNRLGKKAFQDIYNRRITGPNTTQMQSDISNAARITYYFAIQNAIFYTLQTALFAMMFDDDEEDNNNLFLKKKERLINGSIDSVLRGTGLVGGVIATLKNVAIAFARQRDVNYNPDESAVLLEALNLSPVLGIKGRKIVNAEKTLNYNKKVIKEMETFDIDNPQWSAVTNYTEALTNVPLNRLYNKTQNVRQALNNEHSAWERSLMFLGWSQYNLNLKNKKMEDIKESIKSKKKVKAKKRKTPFEIREDRRKRRLAR